MKKFLAILALAAVALNFSSVNLWALEVQEQSASLEKIAAADKKDGSNSETALEAAVVAKDTATPAVVKPADDSAKAVVPAVMEEKKGEIVAVLPDTTKTDAKIS